jgi:hypothetical protein
MAEYKLAEKGLPIWKEQLRSAIDEAKTRSKNLVEIKGYLKENFNIEMKIQNKNVSYLHPDKQKYCRGDKLGGAYTKEGLSSEFEKVKEPAAKEPLQANKIMGSRLDKTPNFDISPAISLSRIGSGIEKITQKIARDIEKENIRSKSRKISTYIPRQKEKIRERER